MKKIFLILFVFYSLLSYSQIQINNVREGYYILYDTDSIKFDDKATEMEAQQGLLNYQLRTGKKGYWDPPTYRIDITGSDNIIRDIEIDTIYAIRVKDLKGWIDFSDLGTKPSKGHAYLPFYEYAIIDFFTDSVYNWQSKYTFERIKTFGKTEYKNLSIPFQYMDIHFLKYDSTRTDIYVKITEKQVRITAWLDGILFKEFLPGSSKLNINEIGFNYWFGITGLIENKEYAFKLETENEKGKIATYQTVIRI